MKKDKYLVIRLIENCANQDYELIREKIFDIYGIKSIAIVEKNKQ